MRLDRIVVDILAWLRSVLWQHHERPGYLPTVIQQFEGKHGLAQQIERDTQRAVSTWLYTPKKAGIPPHQQYRYLLCLDTLGSRDNLHTHRMTFFRVGAWHSLDDEGFDAEECFTGIYDLSGPGRRADYWGALVVKAIAQHLVKYDGVNALDWEFQCRSAISATTGKTPPRQAIKQTNGH